VAGAAARLRLHAPQTRHIDTPSATNTVLVRRSVSSHLSPRHQATKRRIVVCAVSLSCHRRASAARGPHRTWLTSTTLPLIEYTRRWPLASDRAATYAAQLWGSEEQVQRNRSRGCPAVCGARAVVGRRNAWIVLCGYTHRGRGTFVSCGGGQTQAALSAAALRRPSRMTRGVTPPACTQGTRPAPAYPWMRTSPQADPHRHPGREAQRNPRPTIALRSGLDITAPLQLPCPDINPRSSVPWT